MEQGISSEETYKSQVTKFTVLLEKLKRKRSLIGWLRLFIVIGIIFLIYYLFFNSSLIVWISAATGIAIFLYVVSKDVENNDKIADTERMLSINKEELAILAGNYYDREDGLCYLPSDHPYAADIDLFGKGSLYQYINRCTSQQSKKFLGNLLLNPSDKAIIIERQQSAKTLAPFFEWRQQFQSLGMANPLSLFTENKIKNWLLMPKILEHRWWKIMPVVFTTISLVTLCAFLLDWISSGVFWAVTIVLFLVAKFTSSKVNQTYTALTKIEEEIKTIYQQLRMVEMVPASSPIINDYREILVSRGNGTDGIHQLQEILRRFDFRLNTSVFLLLNTFLLWDVRQANNLNNWMEKYAAAVPGWFTILSNIELINTLSTLTFNHPEWCFPIIADQHFTLQGKELGHPLIASSKRVTNDFDTQGMAKVAVITGSNMAGKSTFLRSVAVNLVLAQTGAPVCAAAFTFSPVRLFSSMRIADNLAENTSTFYAELKKLKSIIEQVKDHGKIFILLDEILRGTNSLDRHTGSEAFIRQLIRENAVAIIATHDVELGNLEHEYPTAISNYHFDVQVAGEELYFDYRLKRGICKSLNASILMKKIGIEI